METHDYQERLHDHLTDHPYRPETVAAIGRMCRVGRVSEQTALEFLELVEADHIATDAEMVAQVPVLEVTATSQTHFEARFGEIR